jgi:creatinine amidohydrolase
MTPGPGAVDLSGLTWTEVTDRIAGTLLLVPLGSTEQHGPHLPLSVDTDIATLLCEELARRRPDAVVAPAVAYGSSGEHSSFPGTLSIGATALELLLVELVRSADSFAGVLLVSAHGGNAAPVARAVEKLRYEGRRVRSWAPAPPAIGTGPSDAHAGYVETSVMLALRPCQVRSDRIAAGCGRPLPEIMDELVRAGVGAVSATGVLGDPRGADPEAGQAIFRSWVGDLKAATDGWP